jgi:GTP-binding protein
MADMPGLIEGASEGHGLGHQFLRHIERTLVLVHVVDLFPIDGSDPMENYRTVEAELANYSAALGARRLLVALNKCDLGPDDEVESRAAPFRNLDVPVFVVSGATGEGLEALHREVVAQLDAAERETAEAPKVVADRPAGPAEEWRVEPTTDGFAVVGRPVERAVAMTDLSNTEAVRYLHRKLERMGVIEALREAGVEEGDTVRVGGWEFTFWEG